MTKERLEEIRKRAEAATPGPWLTGEAEFLIAAEDSIYGLGVADFDPGHLNGETDPDSASQALANKEFTIHARTDIPALLAEVERLTARCAEFDSIEDTPAELQVNCGTFKHTEGDPTHRDFISVEKGLWNRIRSEWDEATEALAKSRAEVERLTAELEECKAASGEESSRLNWLINKMNNAADMEDLVEDLFDNLPGDSEDIQMEVRAAIDAKRKRRP